MLDDSVLEVAIGLALIFMVLSLLASGIYEGIAKVLAWRAKTLWAAIHVLVDPPAAAPSATSEAAKTKLAARIDAGDPLQRVRHVAPEGDLRPIVSAEPETYTQRLYAHPLVGGLERRASSAHTRIDRIEPSSFARALIDVLVPDAEGQTTAEEWRSQLVANDAIPDGLKRQLVPLVREAAGDIDVLRHKVEEWFDAQMTALSRGYRKRAKWCMVVIGLVVAVVANVDAIAATERLYRDDALRSALVAEGERITDECARSTGDKRTSCLQKEAEEVGRAVTLPIGWDEADIGPRSALGWLAGGLAIAQGAPFWFDVMKRAMGMRRGRDRTATGS